MFKNMLNDLENDEKLFTAKEVRGMLEETIQQLAGSILTNLIVERGIHSLTLKNEDSNAFNTARQYAGVYVGMENLGDGSLRVFFVR